MSSRILFLVAAGVLGVWSMRRWREAVKLVLVLLVVEGAIRKWVLPGAQELVYFIKDGVLLAAYVGFLSAPSARRARAAIVPQALTMLLVLGAFVGLLQVFNPNLPSLLVGIFGFKAYFLYVPLLWVVPAAFDSREALWRFLYWYAILAIPLGFFALLQFGSPQGSALNTYARGSDPGTIATFGTSSRVRVTATFSYITGYVSYLFASALLILTVLWTAGWRFKGYMALYLSLGLTVVGMLVSGSRAPVAMFAVTFPLFWWLAAARDRGNFEAISRVLVIVVVLGVLVAYGAGDAVSAFYGRASASTDTASRVLSPLVEPFQVAPDAGLFGLGIGATHQAATALVDNVRQASWLHGHFLEAEPGRIMMEVGIVGFLLVYAARFYMIFLAFQQSLVLKDRFCRMVAISTLLFFLAHLPSGTVFNVTSGVFYWFLGGALFLAMRLDREVARGTEAAAPGRAARATAGRPAPAFAARLGRPLQDRS
jgi:hypothetical protein